MLSNRGDLFLECSAHCCFAVALRLLAVFDCMDSLLQIIKGVGKRGWGEATPHEQMFICYCNGVLFFLIQNLILQFFIKKRKHVKKTLLYTGSLGTFYS